jgi:hypothetical protein
MECITCWLCFRMPQLGVINLIGCYHYCSQRSEVLWVSPQGLLNHLPHFQLYLMSYQAGGTTDKCGKPDRIQWKLVLQSLTNQSTFSVGRANVWWYCGGPLLEILPGNWAGTCALVRLAVPFTLAFRAPVHATIPRKRRDIGSQPQRFLGSPIFTLMPLGFLEGTKWI